MGERVSSGVGSDYFCSPRPKLAAGHTLLCEPLDGAGNRGSGCWLQGAQVRDLRRTRPCARGFPSVACDAPLAWFVAAACVPPQWRWGGRPFAAGRFWEARLWAPWRATESKTGSERDCRAAHGAARLRENNVESPFFHGVEPERRVRMRPAATGDIASRWS